MSNQEGTPLTEGEQPLGESGIKALQAEREARKAAEKAAQDAQAKLDEIEKQNLTDLERARKEAQDARAQLAEANRVNLINKVALAKGVPSDLVGLLSGDTEEAVSEKADLLMSHIGGSTPRTPAPDPTQGSGGNPHPASNADAFAQLIEAHLS